LTRQEGRGATSAIRGRHVEMSLGVEGVHKKPETLARVPLRDGFGHGTLGKKTFINQVEQWKTFVNSGKQGYKRFRIVLNLLDGKRP